MRRPSTRLVAAVATALGLIAGGFEAHLAPQAQGWWHGLTGSPSAPRFALAVLCGGLVFLLGRVVSVRPFLWMGAGLLPFVPALTGFGAPLLFFSSSTLVLVFAILLGWTFRDLVSRLPTLKPFSVFLISFAFFLLVGRVLPGPAGPQGDEPHYLLIAESLLKDGDVDLKNQFAERAFSRFTSAELEPHTAPRSPKGKIYAIHTPGLSALIAPGYALMGFAGARLVVSAVMASVVALLFFSARSLFGASTAKFVFLLATFASPLPIYANTLFPDAVAPLPVATTLACLLSMRKAFLGLASAAIATLPWLHPRFLPLALLLALSLALRDKVTFPRTLAVFGPLFGSLCLLLLHFQRLFGSRSLSAAYGPGFSSDVSLARIPWGASALILDRQFGLLLFCPVLLLGLGGARSLWRQDRQVAALLVATIGVVLGVGGSFSMWWGGASAPARFLIAAGPALLIFCGAYWRDSELKALPRTLLGAVSGFGVGLLVLACLAPRTLHNRPNGESGLLRLLSPVLDLDRFFPGFVRGESVWLAALWGGIFIAATVRPRAALWAAALPFAFVALGSSRPILDPFSSSLRALESWNDARRTFGGLDTVTAFALEIPLGAPSWNLVPGVLLYSPRFSLPAGSFTLRVESRSEVVPGVRNVARVFLETEDEGAAALAAIVLRIGEDTAVADFNLEQGQRRLHIRGEGLQSRSTVLSVGLTPRAPVP